MRIVSKRERPRQMNPASRKQRYLIVDVLRGLAIAMMFHFHFTYDLNHFGFLRADFYRDPFWLNYRSLIVSLFLGLVGVSLTLATRRGLRWQAFLRRLGMLLGFAALISIVSYIQFGERFIFFGILHFIALASVLGLLFLRFYWFNLVLGLALILLGNFFSHSFFDQSALQWIGLMTHKPFTEDYVPLLPWFGVVLLGMFLGKLLFQQRPVAWLQNWHSRDPLTRTLAFGGRHSLIIYMLHQPVFMGLLYPLSLLAE